MYMEADADVLLNRVAKEGTPQQEYERVTWRQLAKLAGEKVEAGIHFQGE